MTKKLTVSAMMVALATVLAIISKIIPSTWMQGGSVTLASTLPIAIVSIIIGTRWGIISGGVYALIQMMMGFYPPPTQSVLMFFLVIMLDYILAFSVIGLAGTFYKMFGKKPWSIPAACAVVVTMRFLCHFISGILIWGVYAEKGQSVAVYSLVYNGLYMLPELIITTTAAALLIGVIKRFEQKQSNL